MVASSPASGMYDHPSYLTRQSIGLGINTAGAAGTSGGRTFISDMRVRKMSVAVRTAGTSTAHAINLMMIGTMVTGFAGATGFTLTTATGTQTVGTVTIGTGAAFTTTTSTDMNTRIMAGSVLFLKNGADVVGVDDITLEAYIDPEGSWTGPNN